MLFLFVVFVASYESFYFMTVLAHIFGYLLAALYILGGIGFIGYMFALCRSFFSKKDSGPMPGGCSGVLNLFRPRINAQ